MDERKILVRRFGLANQNFYDDSHIVIALEEGGRRQAHKAERAPSPKNQQNAFP
jgi:hypothetical protein